MPVIRKKFRVERTTRDTATTARITAPNSEALTEPHHQDILTEIRALRALIVSPAHEAQHSEVTSSAQIAEVQKLKTELDLIQDAIAKTKHEIATVHISGFKGAEMARVTHELDAVVAGTEQATQRILKCTEEIDSAANTLSAAVKHEHEQALAHDIQDRVTQIFEACNFQDLTGQRISKVVATLKFIEEHIQHMLDIWGGIDSFKEFVPAAIDERAGDHKLLNGPKLDDEPGHASQDDIDALFG